MLSLLHFTNTYPLELAHILVRLICDIFSVRFFHNEFYGKNPIILNTNNKSPLQLGQTTLYLNLPIYDI